MDSKLKRPFEGADHWTPVKRFKRKNNGMADWNMLPTELLIKIFAESDYTTRLTCKLVCSRWHEILMTDFEFDNDRTLDLRNCRISKHSSPYNIFQHAVYNYSHLILNEESVEFEDFEDVREFWETISQEVTSITYEGTWNSKMVIIFTIFENLKVLKTLESDILHGMSQLSTNFLLKAFNRIEILHVDTFQIDFKRIFPNLKEVFYGSKYFKYSLDLEPNSTCLDKYTANDIEFNSLNDLNTHELPSNVKIIECSYRVPNDESLQKLNVLKNSHPSLKKVNLCLNYAPKNLIPFMIDKLTLENVDVSILDNVLCHKLVLRNMDMKSLNFSKSSNIYKNVKHLKIKLDSFDVDFPVQKLLSYKFSNLRELQIDSKLLHKFSENAPPLKHVRRLSITCKDARIPNLKLSKTFPSVKCLKIKLLTPFEKFQISLTNLFEDLSDLLPNLTYLIKSEDHSTRQIQRRRIDVIRLQNSKMCSKS